MPAFIQIQLTPTPLSYLTLVLIDVRSSSERK